MRPVKLFTLALLLFALPQAVLAQTQQPVQPASAPAQQLLTNAQLDALVAPIALYPDALLSEILMASTYPLEVVEAERWAKANKALKGDALKEAMDRQSWDDSVSSAGDFLGTRHDERKTQLDSTAGRRRAGAAGRRHGRDPTAAR